MKRFEPLDDAAQQFLLVTCNGATASAAAAGRAAAGLGHGDLAVGGRQEGAAAIGAAACSILGRLVHSLAMARAWVLPA